MTVVITRRLLLFREMFLFIASTVWKTEGNILLGQNMECCNIETGGTLCSTKCGML
jgi:hypothetical protein